MNVEEKIRDEIKLKKKLFLDCSENLASYKSAEKILGIVNCLNILKQLEILYELSGESFSINNLEFKLNEELKTIIRSIKFKE